MAFQTEYEFVLPKGYVDVAGNLHKKGVMRLATAADEIFPLKDIRVQQNSAYITVIILARVITKLGDLPSIDTGVIESLFSGDMNYLQDFYQKINQSDDPSYEVSCPHCNRKFTMPISFFMSAQS